MMNDEAAQGACWPSASKKSRRHSLNKTPRQAGAFDIGETNRAGCYDPFGLISV
jgi:hypothetical protein